MLDLFARAHHPYTEGLLGAMPRVGGEKDRLADHTRHRAAADELAEGCRFRDRCPYSWERCERNIRRSTRSAADTRRAAISPRSPSGERTRIRHSPRNAGATAA